VFEDSFHAFTHRNADELRGRLHVTFQDEDGVDAGGLSREFFVSFFGVIRKVLIIFFYWSFASF